MSCVSCQKKTQRITGLNLFQQRLANRKTVNTHSVKRSSTKITAHHKSPISVPRITKEGWEVSCLICGKYGSPKPFAELATSDNCNCEK